jgi:mono/diheme cytochrome c family protein
MFRRVVDVVEVLALVAVVAVGVLLFANEPDTGTLSGGAKGAGSSTPGASVFAANCASCHGADGGGSIGPQLSDGKVARDFPDPADEIAVVTRGRNGMPAFGSRLSADEIQSVVDYTRSL